MTEPEFIDLSNRLAECKISRFGAHLLSFRPQSEEQDIFWLGARNKFDHIQAIRGGIPVCWPRFAAEKLNDHLPRHGFARTSDWQLQELNKSDSATLAKFILPPNQQYNLNVTATLLLKITDQLEYCLQTVNLGTTPFTFSEALHCYFNISAINNITITGLAGHNYKNSLNGEFSTLEQDLKIHGEIDSIFQNQTGKIEIIDPGYQRIISIEKHNSQTTIVWNPAQDLAEMNPGQYQNFVCVEPSNVGGAAITLAPGQTHELKMTISLHPSPEDTDKPHLFHRHTPSACALE